MEKNPAQEIAGSHLASLLRAESLENEPIDDFIARCLLTVSDIMTVLERYQMYMSLELQATFAESVTFPVTSYDVLRFRSDNVINVEKFTTTCEELSLRYQIHADALAIESED